MTRVIRKFRSGSVVFDAKAESRAVMGSHDWRAILYGSMRYTVYIATMNWQCSLVRQIPQTVFKRSRIGCDSCQNYMTSNKSKNFVSSSFLLAFTMNKLLKNSNRLSGCLQQSAFCVPHAFEWEGHELNLALNLKETKSKWATAQRTWKFSG